MDVNKVDTDGVYSLETKQVVRLYFVAICGMFILALQLYDIDFL